jgi:hypothetical protein
MKGVVLIGTGCLFLPKMLENLYDQLTLGPGLCVGEPAIFDWPVYRTHLDEI